MSRWWRGAMVFIAAGIAYAGAAAIVWIVFMIAKGAFGFEASSIYAWLLSGLIAPYLAGKVSYLRILRDVWREADDAEKLKRRRL